MEVMLVGRLEAFKDIALPTFDGVRLTPANSVKSLQVILDPILLLDKQVNAAAHKDFVPTHPIL